MGHGAKYTMRSAHKGNRDQSSQGRCGLPRGNQSLHWPGRGPGKNRLQICPSKPTTYKLVVPAPVLNAATGEPAGNTLGPSGNHGDH